MRAFVEISVGASDAQRELLIPTMVELGAQGFMELETDLLCYFEATSWGEEETEKLLMAVRALLRQISANTEIRIRPFKEENWNEQWERTIKPVEIGNRFVIRPSWAEYPNTDGRLVIQIDPKMSFGTGYHESTRLMMQLLEKHIMTGCATLDVGTGTGILAIAAVKLGSKRAVGIDNDEWSILNANENVAANSVENEVIISDLPLDQITESFDLIVANITLNTIIELLPAMMARLSSGGKLLLAGLLLQDEARIRKEISDHQLSVIELLKEGEWIALAVQRNK